jgi:RHO1 GDP-GTP exchange protein 1/2
MGPRSQPDRRNVAYESIFGRPSASHHLDQPPPNAVQYGQPAYHYPSTNGQHGVNLDRRMSHASSIAPSAQMSPQVAANPYASYYAPQSTPHHQPYPPSAHAPSNYTRVSTTALSAPSIASRARSTGRSPGTIAPLPEEPPDPSLEALTQAGLTPAQAYQAQIYMKSPMGQSQSKVESSPGDRRSAPNGLPQLPLALPVDDGKLGLDFSGDASGNGHAEHNYQYQARSHPESVRSRTSLASSFAPIPEQPVASSSSRPYPLQLDTAMNAGNVASTSISLASSTAVDHSPSGYHSAPPTASVSGRRSSESSRTLPGPNAKRDRISQDRTRSMSAALTPQIRAMLENNRSSRPPMPNMPSNVRDSMSSNRPNHPRRTPIVYPALLSKVSQAFKDRISLADRIKDGLTYKDAFDGREAVDKIAYIIKTTDRNLALLLGRALDAQKFFHAVTYDHRLRDSSNDLYQFRTKMPSPFTSGELVEPDAESIRESVIKGQLGGATFKGSPTQSVESGEKGQRDGSPSPPDSVVSPATRPRQESISSDDVPLPSGVFTLLTDCYSPTCTRDRLCYSIACPRRLEQQARLNMKPQPGLKKQLSKESLGDLVVREMCRFCHITKLTSTRNPGRYGFIQCRKRL